MGAMSYRIFWLIFAPSNSHCMYSRRRPHLYLQKTSSTKSYQRNCF